MQPVFGAEVHDGREGSARLSSSELGPIYSKVTRRVIPLLLTGYILAYLDRVNVGFAKLQMLTDLRFSEYVYGLGAGIFFLGYFIFEVPSNLILHRVGARRWIARIMITWGVVSAAMALVDSASTFYVLRFLLGVAEAGFFPGVIYYLTKWYPPDRRGRIIALLMAGVPVCNVFGSIASGWILEAMNGVGLWAGWQWLFFIEAVPTILLGCCVLLRLTDHADQASWLSAREKAALRADLERHSDVRSVTSFRGAVRDKRVWYHCLIYFSLVTGLYGLGFWLPSIVADIGVSRPSTIGVVTAIPYAVAGVAMVLVGRSADRRQERRWHLAIVAGLGAIGLMWSATSSGSVVATMSALVLATAGILSALPLFWSLPAAYLRSEAAAGGIAVINSLGNLAGFLGPYLVGWTKEASGSIAQGVSILAGFVLFGAVLIAAEPRAAGERRPTAPR